MKKTVCGFKSKTPPCVHSKRPRVCRHLFQHVRVVPVHTGTFLNLHTEGVLYIHTEGRVSSLVLLTKFAHVWLSRDSEVHQRNQWIFAIFSLRIGREQHVVDSSKHSLCLKKLFSFSNPEGHCGGNQL